MFRTSKKTNAELAKLIRIELNNIDALGTHLNVSKESVEAVIKLVLDKSQPEIPLRDSNSSVEL